jgi:hypothetical protein
MHGSRNKIPSKKSRQAALRGGILPFKAYRLRDASTISAFNSCTLCLHCIFVFCVYPRTTCATYSIKGFVL